ncbi:MAG: hypothetical protein LKI24_04455 [Acidipropionibacterium sp.]|nr:hypothetical protein [Acidipropionibacterium sp.]
MEPPPARPAAGCTCTSRASPRGCSRATGNGLEAINSVASTSWGNDGFLLQINGSPTNPDPKKNGYWSYWFWTGGSWQYANVGPYSDTDLSGKVRAWKYIGLKMSEKVPPSWTPPAPQKKPAAPRPAAPKPAPNKPATGSNGGSTNGSHSGSTGGSSNKGQAQGQGQTGSQGGTRTEGQAGAEGQGGSPSQTSSKNQARTSSKAQASSKAGTGSPSASVSPSAGATTSDSAGPGEAARKLAADSPKGPGYSPDGSGTSPWALIGAGTLVVAAVVASVIVVRRRR